MKIKYTAHATAEHGGRGVGNVATDDGKVAVKLSQPKAMGGDDGPGTNPDQLFAMAYSACFLGAMHTAARREKKTLPEGATVTGAVSFADREDNVGFTIVAALEAKVPGWSKDDVEAIMLKAHDICPYSNLIRYEHSVELKAG
ncbi:MAG TPA: Ohr family peroxiredoxin [Devosia sp.]